MKKQIKFAASTLHTAHSTLDYLRCKINRSASSFLQLIVFTLMVVMLNACKRDMSERVVTTLTNKNGISNYFVFNQSQTGFLTQNLIISPLNPNNPVDSIGILHNLYLDYFAKNEIWNYSVNGNNIHSANAQFCDAFMSNYNVYNNYFGSEHQIFFDSLMLSYETNYGYSSTGITNFLENNNFSSYAINYFNQISLIIDSLAIYEGLSIRNKALKSWNKFIQLETNISNDALLSEAEKYLLLSSSSVGRHSLAYTATALTLANNHWLGENEAYDPDVILPEPIFVVVGADWESVVRNDVLAAGSSAGGLIARSLAVGVGNFGLGFLLTAAAAGGASAVDLMYQVLFGEAFLIWVPFP